MKAFTIIETLIVILLTSILLYLIYISIVFFDRQFFRYEQQNIKFNNFQLFSTALKTDLYLSNRVVFNNNNINLISYKNDKTQYSFSESYIIRTSSANIKDSIDIFNYSLKKYTKLKMDFYLIEYKFQIEEDTLTSSFFVKENPSNQINKKFFNEN